MARQARRAGGSGQDHAQHVGVFVPVGEVAELEELRRRSWRVPLADEAARPALRVRAPRQRVSKLLLQKEQVVARGLHAHEQAVERGDVDADRVVPRLERLHERRARAREGVQHTSASAHVPAEQRLDELRDEFPEVGVQTVDVLRALPLGKLRLGPGELEPFSRELAVERGLRLGHDSSFAAPAAGPLSTERDAHDAVTAHSDRLERHFEPDELGSAGEPRVGGGAHASGLLGPDHLERVAVCVAPLLLHLRDHDAASTADDQVDLVPASANVRPEQPVAPESVVEEGPALAAVQAASWRTTVAVGSALASQPSSHVGSE